MRGSVVSLHVEGEMVGPGEGSIAQRALERLLTRVLAEVSRQLIASRKLPRASAPFADVGFLSRVRSHVRLEMRTLRVFLIASWLLTDVYGLSSIGRNSPTASLDRRSVTMRLRVVLVRSHGGRDAEHIVGHHLDHLLLRRPNLEVGNGDGR